MWDDKEKMIEVLTDIEQLRCSLMERVAKISPLDELGAIRPTTVYPLAKAKPMVIKNYPVFQFAYEGMLPHHIRDVNNTEYAEALKRYYLQATLDSYDFSKTDYKFDKSVIIFVHYFKDNIIRDLDNRVKKYIQDAIRFTRLIEDDNWVNVWNIDMAFLDTNKNPHVQVYIVERENLYDFLFTLEEKHSEMAVVADENYKEKVINECIKEIKSKEESLKNNKKTNDSYVDLKDSQFW